MFKIGISKTHLYLSIAFVILGFILIPLTEISNTTKIIWGILAFLHVIKIYKYFVEQKALKK